MSLGDKPNAKIAIRMVTANVISALLSPDNLNMPSNIISSSTGAAAKTMSSVEKLIPDI